MMMDLFYMGNIKEQLKTKAMHLKWQERKHNPFLEKGRAEDPRIKEFCEQTQQQNISARISFIEAKLKSGGKITGSDLEFLKEHAPELYVKAVSILKEREAYRKKLENCETKEEVQQLSLYTLSKFGAEARAVMTSSIPTAKKKEQLEFIGMKVMAVQDEHLRFIGSDRYKSLPGEDEQQSKKARRKSPPREDFAADGLLRGLNSMMNKLTEQVNANAFFMDDMGRAVYNADGRAVPASDSRRQAAKANLRRQGAAANSCARLNAEG